LKVNVHAAGTDAVARKVEQLLAEKKALEKKLEEALRGGGNAALQGILANGSSVGSWRVVAGRTSATALQELQTLGDTVREQLPAGVGVLGGVFDEGKATLVFVVGDTLREKGISAGDLVKAFAAKTGGRGGGKPHLAQMGVDAGTIDATIGDARAFVSERLAGVK
ncbi:MAG: DHHA1 domain-containing protein, partial [Gemmatimonadota bacterium]|nr:DHHA1 domain-containing protein [Gemmatimonadota bacterium]